jgi:hypothetical protein
MSPIPLLALSMKVEFLHFLGCFFSIPDTEFVSLLQSQLSFESLYVAHLIFDIAFSSGSCSVLPRAIKAAEAHFAEGKVYFSPFSKDRKGIKSKKAAN